MATLHRSVGSRFRLSIGGVNSSFLAIAAAAAYHHAFDARQPELAMSENVTLEIFTDYV